MRTLVLNAGYEPLGIVSFKRALVLVLNQKAQVLEKDTGHPVAGQEREFDRPVVIVLTRYVRLPATRFMPVSRRAVLKRDHSLCLYCGAHASTVDHVMPKSRGGRDTWDNLVACCLKCNNIKSDRTPQEMGWTLLAHPGAPRHTGWSVRGADRAEPAWHEYLGHAA